MKLHMVLPSGSHAKLGTQIPITKLMWKQYIRNHQLSWIEV